MYYSYHQSSLIKTILILVVCSISVFCTSVAAQITVTPEDIEENFVSEFSATQQTSTDSASILSLAEISGENQVWDFTALEFEQSITGVYNIYEEITDLPESDDPHFAEATHASRLQLTGTENYQGIDIEYYMDVHNYAVLTENQLISLGGILKQGASESDVLDQEVFTYLDPGRVEIQFPLTFGSTWDYNYESEINSNQGNFTHDYEVSVEVDSWGEIITEAGSESVLRLAITEVEIIGGTDFESTRYSFINEMGLEVATINPDEEAPEATNTSYSTSTSNEMTDKLPSDFGLEQNYPNPFNPSTVINYHLPSNSQVNLEVFDMTGRKVSTLIPNEAKSAGHHSVTFDADELSSGTYIYRLTAGETVLSKKLTIIK